MERKKKIKFSRAPPEKNMSPIERELIMKNKLIDFLKDENGQTSTEYILLVAVVAVIIFKFKGVLETKLTGLIESVFGKSDELLQDL